MPWLKLDDGFSDGTVVIQWDRPHPGLLGSNSTVVSAKAITWPRWGEARTPPPQPTCDCCGDSDYEIDTDSGLCILCQPCPYCGEHGDCGPFANTGRCANLRRSVAHQSDENASTGVSEGDTRRNGADRA